MSLHGVARDGRTKKEASSVRRAANCAIVERESRRQPSKPHSPLLCAAAAAAAPPAGQTMGTRMRFRTNMYRSCFATIVLVLVLVLELRVGNCSAFAPTPENSRTLLKRNARIVYKPSCQRQRNGANAIGDLSSLYASPSSYGDSVVASSYAQTFLAESEASGMVMTKRDQNWWARFEELEEYKREIGDCNVPQKYKANPQLGIWVNNQRQFYKNNKLESKRIEALEGIGFEWARPTGPPPDDANWWTRFGELEEYRQQHGDCNVPQHYKANPQLATWVKHQRQRYQHKKLSSERIEALEGIGFEWVGPTGVPPDDANWWEQFQKLEEYRQERGDCNVPISYKANPQLATWVMNQRAYYHRFIDENRKQSRGITKERIEALNKIGFEWRLRERPEWDERYDELAMYKEQHGNTLVPRVARGDSDNKYRQLATWVDTQRRQYRLLQKGKHSYLTDERIDKLNQIGFVWDAQEAAWEEMFAELVSYREMHGDLLVSKEVNKELYMWAQRQRAQYQRLQKGKHSRLTDERIRKLNSISFDLAISSRKWETQYSALASFWRNNGICKVPHTERTLYDWARRQLRDYRTYQKGSKTAMNEERVEALTRIGFFDVYDK